MPCTCHPHWTLYAEASKAADEILTGVFNMRPSKKDDRDYLTRRGFEGVLRQLTTELILTSRQADERALRECLTALNNNWRGMPPDARDAAIERAAQALGGVPRIIVSPVIEALSRVGRQVVTGTKQSAKGLYDLPIKGAFDLVDETVVKHAAESHAFFVRDEYGKRQAAASQRAREIVSAGVELGLDRTEIGRKLGPVMASLGVQRSERYWPMVASVFASRSRTWGVLSSFAEAEIEEYEISCTLDEVSCSACRLMHGKVLSTGAAVSRFEQVASSDDPEAVRDFMPFLGVAQSGDQEAVYFKRGDARRAVGQVVESGVGHVDDVGRYGSVMGRGAMEASGMGIPPFHPHCRCTMHPSARSLTQVQVPVRVEERPGFDADVRRGTLTNVTPFGPKGINAISTGRIGGHDVFIKPAAKKGVDGARFDFDPADAVSMHHAVGVTADAIGDDLVQPASLRDGSFITKSAGRGWTTLSRATPDVVKSISDYDRLAGALIDFLHKNSDRHDDNVLVNGGGRITLIDHDRAHGHVPPSNKKYDQPKSVFFPSGHIGYESKQRTFGDLPPKMQEHVKAIAADSSDKTATMYRISKAEAEEMQKRARDVVDHGLDRSLAIHGSRVLRDPDGDKTFMATLGRE